MFQTVEIGGTGEGASRGKLGNWVKAEILKS